MEWPVFSVSICHESVSTYLLWGLVIVQGRESDGGSWGGDTNCSMSQIGAVHLQYVTVVHYILISQIYIYFLFTCEIYIETVLEGF